MCSNVADATDNVKYKLNRLWTSPRSVLMTDVLLKALQRVVIFVS